MPSLRTLLPLAALLAALAASAPAQALTITGTDTTLSADHAIASFTFDFGSTPVVLTGFHLELSYDNALVQFEPAEIGVSSYTGSLVPDFDSHGTLSPALFPGGYVLDWAATTTADGQALNGSGVLNLGFSNLALGAGASTPVHLAFSYTTAAGSFDASGVATLSAVPEPATRVLALLGLAAAGGVGAVARRGRAAAAA